MQTVRITTSQNIDIEYEVAGLGERMLGYIIDIGIFVVSAIAIILILNSSDATPDKILTGIIIIVWLLTYACYDLICEVFFNGQSLGKRIMKIRVVSLDGSRPTLGQFLLRWLFRIVDFSLTSNLAGLISVAVSTNKQRIGDMVAGTTVVRTAPRTTIEHIAFIPPDESYQPLFPEAQQLRSKDIMLIHEVIGNVKKSGNATLLYETALRVKQTLTIGKTQMDDLTFLQTIVKDYNYYASGAEV